MSLNQALKNYISAQEKNKEAKHELSEATTKLEMECRRTANSSDITNWNLKTIASILSSKLQ